MHSLRYSEAFVGENLVSRVGLIIENETEHHSSLMCADLLERLLRREVLMSRGLLMFH